MRSKQIHMWLFVSSKKSKQIFNNNNNKKKKVELSIGILRNVVVVPTRFYFTSKCRLNFQFEKNE
jgi:plastocyanin domain-containing protein